MDQNDEQPGRRPLVLVVEDHPEMQQTLVDILALGNIGALTADNGNLALTLLEQRSPDLVLLDVNLSGRMTGIEVLSAIRKHVRLSSTPVIILSVEDTVLYDYAAESADMVLLKPVNPDDLLTLVERLLGSSAHNG